MDSCYYSRLAMIQAGPYLQGSVKAGILAFT